MSNADLLSARVTQDAWRVMRMLTFAIIYAGVIISPIVVLSACYWGWKAVETYAISR